MAFRHREYTNQLTMADRIKVRYVQNGHRIVTFSVQYEVLLGGHWRKITRYDNAHGYPHRHTYYPNHKEYKTSIDVTDTNLAFTQALEIIKSNFKRIKEPYILSIDAKETHYE